MVTFIEFVAIVLCILLFVAWILYKALPTNTPEE